VESQIGSGKMPEGKNLSDSPADRSGTCRLSHAVEECVMLRLIFAIMVATLEKSATRS